MRLKTRELVTVEHEGYEYEFEPDGPMPDEHESEIYVTPDAYPQWFVQVGSNRYGPYTRQQAGALEQMGVRSITEEQTPCLRVSWIVRDDDAVEFEFGQGVWSGEYEDWEPSRYAEYEHATRASHLIDLHDTMPGRVFIVHKEDRGAVNHAWSEPFDPSRIIVDPDDPEDRTLPDDYDLGDGFHTFGPEIFPDPIDPKQLAEASTGVWDEWTRWANGDVWGVITNYVDHDGNVIAKWSVWGFIGQEYAESEAKAGNY